MVIHTLAQASAQVLTELPNPAPVAPPGSEKILQVVGILKWVAGLAVIAGFFGGVAVFAGGRLVDHHRIGRIGTIMMVASFAAAILYAVGYTLLSSFAG